MSLDTTLDPAKKTTANQLRPKISLKPHAVSKLPVDHREMEDQIKVNAHRDSELEKELKARLTCEVRFDTSTKAMYSTDASNYHHVPVGVVFPRTADEIITIVECARKFGVPILSRGGGTSLAGQSCNEALMIETSKYYHQILELNVDEKFARVQPGIVLDTLRDAAKKHDLTFGPDPATHNHCTLGGMMGNNSCGVHSVMAGKTVDNVIELDVLTYDGTRMTVGETTAEEFAKIMQAGGRKAEIYKSLLAIREDYQELIETKYPVIPRRVSGYNLDDLLPKNKFNVAKALIGTEGTCVLILEAKLKLVPQPQKKGIVMIGFDDIFSAGDSALFLRSLHPIGLEGMDDEIVQHMRTKSTHVKDIEILPGGKAWMLFEVGAPTEAEVAIHAELVSVAARKLAGFKDVKVVLEEEAQKKMWEVRDAGLGVTAYVPGQRDTWEGWEDSAVPVENVGKYLRELKKLYAKYNYEGVLYGHFGDGCIHTRITFDLITADGIKTFREYLHEAAHLVVKYGGSISGEHGDGQSKAELLPIMFGPELIVGFEKFKDAFDPLNKMNPGKIVRPRSPVQDLRLGTSYAPLVFKTHFAYPEDRGDMSRAVLRCVGVGACRKKDGGTMCPSYMVTHEEKHSTRGRAHLLFEMMQGTVIKDGWQSEEVKESLDLCLACKGCKTECPVNVDMATYKAEFLSHYYQKHLRPRMAYAMGQINRLAKLGSLMPRLVNFIMATPGLSTVAKYLAGIHPARVVPKFALRTFRSLSKKRISSDKDPSEWGENAVVLWVDTFNNHFHPDIAQAAERVLVSAGFEVHYPPKSYCCGRPLYDFGFLDQARNYLSGILKDLAPVIRRGTPFVFLEPSCASVFRDELGNLFPHDRDAYRLNHQTFMLSEILIKKAPNYRWPELKRAVTVQGHCHHKSILNFDAEKEVFKRMKVKTEALDSGCCGMAGAFGFSRDHYHISQKAGERVLFGKIKGTPDDTLIIANGFSCREQIQQGTGRKVHHLAEILDPQFLAREGAVFHDPIPPHLYDLNQGRERENQAQAKN
jgi:FAD/FMN-containing dehydrogenase/Fe-S oxidoreductase